MGKEVVHKFIVYSTAVIAAVMVSFGYCQTLGMSYQIPWFQVTTLPGKETSPALSPDGKWLAFVSDQNGNQDIWVMPAGGGVAKPLTTHPSSDYSPAWLPDGKGIVFVSTREDAFGDLWWLSLDYSEQDILPHGRPKKLTVYLGKDVSPVVSPDGKWIAFTSNRGGRDNIWLMNWKKKTVEQVTFDGGREPAWFPDGKSLLFVTSDRDDIRGNIYKVDLPVSDERKPESLNLADFVQGFPSVSPDGKEMAWIRITRDTNKDGVLDWSDGSGVWKQALGAQASAIPEQLTLDVHYALWTHWGVDGWIYFSSNRGGGVDIWKVKATGAIPSFPTAEEQYNRGRTYLAGALASGREPTLQERELARLCYQKVINDFPDSAEWCARSWYRISQLYGDQGFRDQQTYVLRRILRFYADYPEISAQAEVDYQVILWRESFSAGEDTLFTIASAALVDNLNQFISQHPSQVRATSLARLSIANAYLKARRNQRALEEYIALRDIGEPPDIAAEAQMRIAGIFEQFGQQQEVIQSYLRVVTDYPDEVEWNRKAIDRIIDLAISEQSGNSVVEGLQQIIQRYRNTFNLAAAAQLRIGRELFNQGEPDLSLLELESLEGYRRRNPNLFIRNLSAEARLLIARIYFDKGNTVEAIAWYRKVMDEDGDLAEGRFGYQAKSDLLRTLISRGERLENQNDRSLALAEYRRAIALDSSLIVAWQGLIRCAYQLDQLNDEESGIESALADRPEDPVLWYAMGLALSYRHQDSYLGTLLSNRWLEGAIARHPHLTPVYVTLGFNYLALDQIGGKARKRSVFETLGESITTISRWITFHRQPPEVDWLERAINILRIGIALNDEVVDPRTEARLLINMGNAYYQLGEFGFGTAASSYLQGLKLNPAFLSIQQQALVRERLGHCLAFGGKYSDAVNQLNQARDLYVQLGDVGGEWRVLLRLGESYTLSSDHDGASEVFKDVSNRVERVGEVDSRELWLRNIAQQNLNMKDWAEADRFAVLALAELDSTKVYHKTKIKNYLKFKIMGVSIPLINFGLLGTGSSKAEGFVEQDEWELNQSIRGIAAIGRKDFQTQHQVVSDRLKMAEHTGDLEMKARLTYQMGMIEYRMGDYELALALFKNATRICLDHPSMASASFGAIRGVTAQGNLLLTATVEGEDSVTARWFEKQYEAWDRDVRDALNLWKGRGGRLSQDAAVLANLRGSLLFQRFLRQKPVTVEAAIRRWELAGQVEAQFREALSVAEETRFALAQAVVEYNLGKSYLEFADLEKASNHLTKSYQIAVANGLTEVLWRTEFAIAELRRLFDTPGMANSAGSTVVHPSAFLGEKSSAQWVSEALKVLESLPVNPENYEELTGHRQSALDGFDLSMDLALRGYDGGVDFMELAERRSALQWLWAAGAKPFAVKQETQKFIWGEGGGNAPYLQRELERLSAAIRSEREKEKVDRNVIASLEKQYQSIHAEYEDLLDQVWKDDPEFGSLFSLRTATVSEVQKSLEPDEAVLRTISHRGKIYSWVILPDTLYNLNNPDNTAIIGKLKDRIQKWTWILDPGLLHIPTDELFSLGIPVPSGNASRVGDFRSYLTAASKQEVSGTHGVVVNKGVDGISLDSLPQEWKAVDASALGIDQVIDAMYGANFIYIDLPIMGRVDQPLSSYFDLGSDRLYFSQLFSRDLPAAAVLVRWNISGVDTNDQGVVMNALLRTLMFAGIPSLVIVPSVNNQTWADAGEFGRLLLRGNMSHALLSDSRFQGWILLGSHGMDREQAAAYAQENFNRTVLKGNLNLKEGNSVWATRYYRRARQMAVTLGQEKVLRNIDLLLLKSASDGRRWQEAEEVQQRLLDDAQRTNDQGNLLQGWKNLAFYRTQSGDVAGALAAWDRVLSLAKAEGDDIAQVNTHLSRSDLFRSSRQKDAALGAVDRAYKLSVEASLPHLALTSLVQRAKIHFEFDDVDSALGILETAQSLLDSVKVSEATRSLAVSIFEIKGRIMAILGRYSEALSFTQRALEATRDSTQIGYLTQRMADLYWESGKLLLASQWAGRADSMFQRIGDKSYQLLNQNTRSLIALSLGDKDQAVMLAGTALELATDIGDSANVAIITRNIGLIELESGKAAQAVLRFKEARQLDQRLQRTSGLAHDLANLGLAYMQDGQRDSALSAFSSTLSVGETMSDPRSMVKTYIGQALIQKELGNPLAVMEMLNRAQEAIGDRPLGQYLWRIWYYRGMTYQEQNQLPRALASYEQAIDALERDPVAGGNIRPTGLPGRPEDAFDRAVVTALALGDVQKAFLLSDQKRRWRRDQPFLLEGLMVQDGGQQEIAWEAVQAQIPDGTVLLAYHVTVDTTYLFIATPEGLEYRRIGGGETALGRLVDDLRTAVVKLLSVDAPSQKLYQKIISPAETWLEDARQVIVLPSGALWSVPFCVLADDSGRMLIERFPIVYLSGLDRLTNHQPPAPARSADLIAVAYPRSDLAAGELIFAEREVRRIALLVPSAQIYMDNRATESLLDTSKVFNRDLHFACHGWSKPYDLLASGILLGTDDARDGIWQAREIAGKSLTSPLVFLNLCPVEENLGNPHQQVLSEAFRKAGCDEVISPLWEVDDLAAAVMAKLYYRFQGDRNSDAAETLRRAQIGVRDKVNSHPAYWAGYTLQY